MGKYHTFIKESDLFYKLTVSQLERIEELCEERVYQPGETIFEENSRSTELYLILNGRVEILLNPALVSPENAGHEPISIASLWRGQSFGEIALVDEGVRSASARAAAPDTRVLKISRQKFLDLCSADPEMGHRVMFNLALDLSQKIRSADLKIREVLLYQKPGAQDPATP